MCLTSSKRAVQQWGKKRFLSKGFDCAANSDDEHAEMKLAYEKDVSVTNYAHTLRNEASSVMQASQIIAVIVNSCVAHVARYSCMWVPLREFLFVFSDDCLFCLIPPGDSMEAHMGRQVIIGLLWLVPRTLLR